MDFQNNNMSSGLCSFGDLRIFFNRQMNSSHVKAVRKLDSSYVPRGKFPLNRTVVHVKSNLHIQLDINVNLCEIIIPSNHLEFKKIMFKQVVKFLVESIKLICDYRLANEIGYKILIYVLYDSPAYHPQ